MWEVAGQAVHLAAAVLQVYQEAAAPTVPAIWGEEVAAKAALEDQGVAPPPCVARAPDHLASPSRPHASPSLFTTITPRALRVPTDQQVCGHSATHSRFSPSPLTPVQATQLMESC